MNEMPKKLTTQEWNFLNKLAEYSGLDSWFTLVNLGDEDAVYDLDNEEIVPLCVGLIDFAEGVYYDVVELNGVEIWNGIMDKFCGGLYHTTY